MAERNSKIILHHDEGRERLLKGVRTLAAAVKATLGPGGSNALIEQSYGAPKSTKDGVTVAKAIELEDPIENMGAQLVKDVASGVADEAGDGTTTATVLAEAIFTEGLKNLAAGADKMDLRRGIEIATAAVVEELKRLSRQIGEAEIEQIATISANNDPAIGKLIASAMKRVGADGVITVEEGKSTEMRLEVVEGMQYDRGYIAPSFITNVEKMSAEQEDPYILLVDKKISTVQELLPILEGVLRTGRPLCIIAEDVETEPLRALILNKLRGAIQVAATKAPAFGDRRKAILQNIAVLTGGKVFGGDQGEPLPTEERKVQLAYLGRAEKVRITKESTTIINGKGRKEDIEALLSSLKAQINATPPPSSYEKEKLQEQFAQVASKMAVLYTGGATEVEEQDRRDRMDDALSATRAAVEEGVVPGGGVSFLRARDVLDGVRGANEDQNTGIQIVKRALEAPVRTILSNAMGDSYHTALYQIQEGKGDFGLNVSTHTFGSLHGQGVIDPTKVARLALQKAASAAALLLTTECVIASLPQKEKELPMGGHGMHGMM